MTYQMLNLLYRQTRNEIENLSTQELQTKGLYLLGFADYLQKQIRLIDNHIIKAFRNI